MNGLVYFMADGKGLIKIGFTSNEVRDRKNKIRSNDAIDGGLEILATIEGTMKREKSLHKELNAFRVRGEWFRDCDELRARMTALAEEDSADYHGDGPRRAVRDQYTIKAAKFARLLEEREASDAGTSVPLARRTLAKRMGIPPGSFENLRRDRLARVSADDLERLALAVIALLQADIDEAQNIIAFPPVHKAADALAGLQEVIRRAAK